jgi:ABC-2 type transport system permease protein
MIAPKALRIAKREYLAQVRTKAFVIGLLLAPVLMGGSAIAFALLKDRVDTEDKRVAVVDRSGLVAEALVRAAEARNAEVIHDEQTGKKIRPAYVFEIVDPATLDPERWKLELSNRVRDDELHAFVEIGPDVLHPAREGASAGLAYHAEGAALDQLREWMERPINDALRRARAVEAGVGETSMGDLFAWINTESMGLVSADPESGEITEARRSNELQEVLTPAVMAMLLFMMIMWGAMPQLQAVMQEKSQRIAEVILGSVRPFDFMLGKLAGGVGVSLTVATFYVVVAHLVLGRVGLAEAIPYHTLPWFFGYVLIAIPMFGALMAALGAACNDVTEAQSVSFIAMLPLMIPMFVMMPVLLNPTSSFSTTLSLIPPFTPMLMMLRISAPAGVPSWQAWLGFVDAILFTLFLIWLGGRVFRVAIMTQGTPPKLGNIVRWALRG